MSEQHGQTATWQLDGDRAPLTSERLMTLLAARKKPILVSAVARLGRIAVMTKAISDVSELRTHREDETRSFESLGRFVAARVQDDTSPPTILLKNSWESMVVPLALVRDWFLEYRVECSAVYVRMPDLEATKIGAAAAMILKPSRGIKAELVIVGDTLLR